MKRQVVPEILDHLPADDPGAIAGRRDLRRVNFLMGNERWICRAARRFPWAAARGIVELGAGEGALAGKLARMFPQAPVAAVDLAPAPAHLDPRVDWRQGDLFSQSDALVGGLLVANLFLHHFEADALRAIGRLCGNFEVLVFSEPDRARLPHVLGRLLHPFIHPVTRHDLHVSIRAGFSHGELPALLDPGPGWRFAETSTWRGGRRVLGWRT